MTSGFAFAIGFALGWVTGHEIRRRHRRRID